jgi:hypothetical protein
MSNASIEPLVEAKCYFVTFNVFETKLEEIPNLLPQTVPGSEANDFNIFVIALQNIPHANASMNYYKLRLDIHFNQAGRNVELFQGDDGFVVEGSAALLLYMKKDIQSYVDTRSVVKCGVSLNEGKTEACLIKFKLDGTTICITNVNVKSSKWAESLKLLHKWFNDKLCDGVDYMSDSNASIILGNFDAYLNIYEGKVTNALKKKKWEDLFKSDPILNMQNDYRLLSYFKEMKVNFAPTKNYKRSSEYFLGYTDRLFYKATKGCDIKPLVIHTKAGSKTYCPILPPSAKFKFTQPVTAALFIPIHSIKDLCMKLRALKVHKDQLPSIGLKSIELNVLEGSKASEGSIYLSFSGVWMVASVNNRSHFSKYGELNKTWSANQLPTITFKVEAQYAGIDEKVLQYQNMAITLMHQNGISEDTSCGTAIVNLASSFKYSGPYTFEADIVMQGVKVGSIRGALNTTYGHRGAQQNRNNKNKVVLRNVKDPNGEKKKKVKGGMFNLFTKKTLVAKKHKDEIKQVASEQSVVLSISGAKEEYVNGGYYPFLKRLRSAINAKEDTIFNTKVAYRNSHHVILSSGTKNDVDGWIIELLGENLYFCRHNNDIDVPLKGFGSWTSSHNFNPVIKICQDLQTKQELFDTQRRRKVINAIQATKSNTKLKLAIKRLIKTNKDDSGEGKNQNLYEAVHKFDDYLQESTSIAVENFEKIKNGFLSSLIEKRHADDSVDKDSDKTVYMPIFGNAWGQEERVKIHIKSDPTSTAIKLCRDERIKARLPKLTKCPMSVKIEGVIAVSQIPLLKKLLSNVEQDIDMYLYRLAKMYMKSATNIAALEEALEIYDGGAYSGKVRAIYENRLEKIESGET